MHLEAFRDQVARGLRSQATLEMHERTWRYLVEYFGARADVRRFTRARLKRWLVDERRGRLERSSGEIRELAAPTLRLRLCTLRAAMKVARREGLLRTLPEFPETAFVYRSRTPFLEDPGDFWRIFDELTRTAGPERAEYFALCVFTCQRASDVEAMKVGDISPWGRRPWVTIRSTKNRREPVRVVCPRELARIFRRKFLREGSKNVNARLLRPWPARARTLPDVCRRLGLPRITATAARHTGITWAVSRVGITPALLRWTGHRNPNIVAQVYAHALPEQLGDVAAAFDAYARRGRRKVPERMPPAGAINTSRGRITQPGGADSRRVGVPRDGIEPPTQGFSAPLRAVRRRRRARPRSVRLLAPKEQTHGNRDQSGHRADTTATADHS